MNNSLILYETYYGTSKKAAEVLSLILANSKVEDIKECKKDLVPYENIICLFSFHGNSTAESTVNYLGKHKEEINNKKLMLIGVGLSKKDLEVYCNKIEKVSEKAIYHDFIEGELRVDKLTDEDKKALEAFLGSQNMKLMDMGVYKLKDALDMSVRVREKLNEYNKKLEDNVIKESVEKFLKLHNTCSLAVGYETFIRNTPIEYQFIDGNMYFITEGGLKFYGILQNPNVCITVYEDYKNMGNLKGLQITGKAGIVELNSDEYRKVIETRKLKMETINKLPIKMNILRVEPEKYEFLNSDFRKEGAEVKQELNLNKL